MKKCIAGVFIFAIASTSAYAVEPYLGINLVDIAYKEEGFPTANPIALSLKGGANINKYFAVEGRIGTGISDDKVDVSGVSVSVEADNFYGVYAKGIAPVSNVVSLYGLIGYTKGKLTASALGTQVEASDSDVSFGVGADFNIRDIMSINVEWGQFIKGDGYKVQGFSVGVSKKF